MRGVARCSARAAGFAERGETKRGKGVRRNAVRSRCAPLAGNAWRCGDAAEHAATPRSGEAAKRRSGDGAQAASRALAGAVGRSSAQRART
ncbi:hypothetical protein AQ477_00175 [Burkholderia thailandensis]|nr:hypothetical protein AQ477_00175 [Burkholderia thailandensis]PNE75024.1 hypothetical protein A8H37_25265 [Burkholderia thailandensis]